MLPDRFESQTASLSHDPMNRALLISCLFTTQSISNHMILIKLIVPIRSISRSLSSSLQLGARNMSKLSEQGQLRQFTFDYREPQSEGDMWEEENKFKCES